MHRLGAFCKCQLATFGWGPLFSYMGLNQALRDIFFRVNRYQVDGNCRKVADFLHDDVKSFYYERLDHPGLPKSNMLVGLRDLKCFSSVIDDLQLFVNNDDGELLSQAAQLSQIPQHSQYLSAERSDDDPFLRDEADAIHVAARAAGIPHTAHIFADVTATFKIRHMGALDVLQHNLMCIPIDEGTKEEIYRWRLQAYVGGLTHRKLGHTVSHVDKRPITFRPANIIAASANRISVDHLHWKIVDAYQL